MAHLSRTYMCRSISPFLKDLRLMLPANVHLSFWQFKFLCFLAEEFIGCFACFGRLKAYSIRYGILGFFKTFGFFHSSDWLRLMLFNIFDLSLRIIPRGVLNKRLTDFRFVFIRTKFRVWYFTGLRISQELPKRFILRMRRLLRPQQAVSLLNSLAPWLRLTIFIYIRPQYVTDQLIFHYY